ncbi:hypothetical protein OG474_26320 [Kribbella sp. NBC_01505]|uniref:hypothetical protein n=1 Tax=Kribbella sp. NBC_01505 TaxID=2903580 RepID=UPI003868C01F
MSGRQESLADAVIRSTDWASFELFNGTADGFGELLAAFIAADESRTADDLWDTMDNRVFAQDDIFSAAEPTIEVLLAALSEPRSRTAWIGILDLLFHLVQPASYRGDELGGRCLMVAAQGGWLLVREALASDALLRDACLEILDICAPDCARAIRMVHG